MLIAAGCADHPTTPEVTAAAPLIPAGQARIWFYRDWQPSDVSPGHYHIAPQSYGQDFNQDKDIDLAPGQQVYCGVASLRSWEEGGDVAVFNRDTFYIRLMPPEVAQAAIIRNRSGI
jgi:hypothetical protein